jgi:hypothetical protein
MPYKDIDEFDAFGALFEFPSPPRTVVTLFASGDAQIDEALKALPYWVKQEIFAFWTTGQVKGMLLTHGNDSLAFRDGLVFYNGTLIERPS